MIEKKSVNIKGQISVLIEEKIKEVQNSDLNIKPHKSPKKAHYKKDSLLRF